MRLDVFYLVLLTVLDWEESNPQSFYALTFIVSYRVGTPSCRNARIPHL